MTTVSDVAGQFKNALVAAAVTAVDDDTVKVCYGHPGTKQPDDIMSVGRITASIDFATVGTNRTRELVLTAEVKVSVFRRGGPDQEQVAGDRAYALMNALEEYVRAVDTTLGGVVRWCFCTGHDSDGSTDPELLAQGRCIEVDGTFTARARITS